MAQRKVFIGVGHGGSDPGACDNGLRESDLNLRQAFSLKKHLDRNGIANRMSRTCDEEDTVTEEAREANEYNPDLAIDMHTNAGGGKGFEVLYYKGTGTSYKLACAMDQRIKEGGYISRGIKYRLNSSGGQYFCFIREVDAPSVITEMCFIDNWDDMQHFDEDYEIDAYTECLCKAICDIFGMDYIPATIKVPETSTPSTNPDEKLFFRVVVGSYRERANAVEQQEALKANGFDSFLDAFQKDGDTYFRVIAGSYNERSNANAQMDKVKAAGFDAFLAAYRM